MHDARPPNWKVFAGLTALGIGVLGFVASAAVGGGPSLEGAILAGVLNPLFFIGAPLGLYWLLTANPQAKEAEGQYGVKHASRSAATVPPKSANIPSEIEFHAAQKGGVGAFSVLAIISVSLAVGGAIGFKLGLESSTQSTVRTPRPLTSTAEKLAEDEVPSVQIPTEKPNDDRTTLAEPRALASGHAPEKGKQQFRLSFTQPYAGRIGWNIGLERKGQVPITLDGKANYGRGAFAMLGTALREKNLMKVVSIGGNNLHCAVDESAQPIIRLDGSTATYLENPQFNLQSSQADHDLRALRLTFPSAECGEVIETSPQWKVQFPRSIKTYVGDVLLIYRCEEWLRPHTSCVAAVRVSDGGSDSTHFSVEPAKIKRDWNKQPLQVGDYALYLGQPL